MKKVSDDSQLSRLMQQQNKLLERQNELLEQFVVGRQQLFSNGGGYVEDIEHDEMRNGYIVTSHRKKLWNVQIGLINEFARICKKHNLRWFIYAGSLLGAARHKGFIPWDDDVDVAMLRPDYMKFQSIVEDELKNHPYYSVWQWFNYRLETDAPNEQIDMSLPLISKEQQFTYPMAAPFNPATRILDKRTTFLMPDKRKNVFSSIWLDIFPLDNCPPFDDDKTATIFEANREILAATVLPEVVKNVIDSGKKFLLPREDLLKILRLPYKQRAQLFERTALENFCQSSHVGEIKYFLGVWKEFSFKAQDFARTVYLPFEKIQVPAPKGYEDCLTAQYGDWRKPVFTHKHAQEWSTEIPYEQYIQLVQSEE